MGWCFWVWIRIWIWIWVWVWVSGEDWRTEGPGPEKGRPKSRAERAQGVTHKRIPALRQGFWFGGYWGGRSGFSAGAGSQAAGEGPAGE
jgi:hypothetical protein